MILHTSLVKPFEVPTGALDEDWSEAFPDAEMETEGFDETVWTTNHQPAHLLHDDDILKEYLKVHLRYAALTRLPQSVVEAIRELELPSGAQEVLVDLKTTVEGSLADMRQRHSVRLDISTDYEFPDDKQIKIVVGVDDDLENILLHVRPIVYDATLRRIPPDYLGKVFIEFQSLRAH